jgi:hypothetical protein
MRDVGTFDTLLNNIFQIFIVVIPVKQVHSSVFAKMFPFLI